MACECMCHWQGCVECDGHAEGQVAAIELRLFFMRHPEAEPYRRDMLHIAERVVALDWNLPMQEIYAKLYRLARTWDGHSIVRA